MDVKTLQSILSSPETRELLLKAVDFARVKGQVNDLQNQVRRLRSDLDEGAGDLERLDDKLGAQAKSVDALGTRTLVALGMGGGAFLLALEALILALR